MFVIRVTRHQFCLIVKKNATKSFPIIPGDPDSGCGKRNVCADLQAGAVLVAGRCVQHHRRLKPYHRTRLQRRIIMRHAQGNHHLFTSNLRPVKCHTTELVVPCIFLLAYSKLNCAHNIWLATKI